MAKQKSTKFAWQAGDIEVSDKISIPKRLQTIVSNAPRGDKEKAAYLQGLLEDGKITVFDVSFLIQSGALNNA